uniref:RNA polymerase omega subunit n=1 Tax=Hildenbrandia rubra TaxID=31481 RepID=A0A1C9CG21_9FLOR|nr:hypothetical protein Hrub_075 [Hildenbrandia rubra]AOM67319.1 hypothetical protein Hrub_075 [Hildenbrandia rubra]
MISQTIQNNEIIYKTEELLHSSSNRYSLTLKVAQRAKRKKYEDLDIVTEPEIKPVIRAIIEMANELTI